ncbi:hypothetical protein [Candidatus Methylobacter oryzae]|uniref:Uncharacterized protein n=1 Tax=Candidatus Methylobacter oryzae TaxID=2497749 RepID=A0ABY3CCL3_9GAMM|nr:hypothetical protein [Candidatus Methylobacter oryzae]TRW99828.1 hypothetical protein EKO24_006510 [Candidatus Methylobacter oryzae]
MNRQSAQTPILRENITLTLSSAEQDALARCLHVASLNQLTIMDACYLINVNNKLKFLTESGDACRHPAQSPDVVEQDGTVSLLQNHILVSPSDLDQILFSLRRSMKYLPNKKSVDCDAQCIADSIELIEALLSGGFDTEVLIVVGQGGTNG